MKENRFKLKRTVTPEECSWLDKAVHKGTIVFQFYGATYGCITPNGTAVSIIKGKGPFFELPNNSLELYNIVDSVPVENGKYEIVLEQNYDLNVYRGGELWLFRPQGSKMLISILYELLELKKLVHDIAYDFDPDERLGPPCGPEMLKRIKEYEEKYGKLDF